MEQLQIVREGLLLQGHVHELLKQHGMLPAGSRVPIKLWKKPLQPWEKTREGGAKAFSYEWNHHLPSKLNLETVKLVREHLPKHRLN